LNCQLPECPVGGEIKTQSGAPESALVCYQNAPLGARSKQLAGPHHATTIVTRMPRWGRDQNVSCVGSLKENVTRMPRWGRDQNRVVSPMLLKVVLPECPVGGEIKTDAMWPEV